MTILPPVVIAAFSPIKQRSYYWTGEVWTDHLEHAYHFADRAIAQRVMADAPRKSDCFPPRLQPHVRPNQPATAGEREAKNVR